MADDIDFNLRYYVQSHGHAEILTELDANGMLGPESWIRIVKGALRGGDTKIAKYMIASHVQDRFLNSLLLSASEADNVDIIEQLLQRGAEINALTNGESALCVAVGSESLQAVKLLLKRSADPNVSTASGLALHKAIQLTNRKMVEALLKHGASVNAEDDSALHWAITSRDWDIIRLILNKKPADTEVGRSVGYDWVAEIDKLLKLFKKTGLKATIFPGDSQNCMYKAIRDNNVRELMELLKHRDVKMVAVGDRLTPLHVASFYKRETVAEVLLSCGADAFAKDMCAYTPVDYVIRNRELLMLQVFLKMGTRFNEHSEMLLRAALYELPSFVECMIQYGADVNVTDERGYTSLHIAATNGDEKCVRTLLDAGADPNAVCNDGTALHCVTRNVGTAVTKLLLDYGTDINIIDAKCKTAFEKCVLHRPKTLGTFLGHIVKLKSANMFLSDANTDCWVDGWFDSMGDEMFATKCEREIDRMKNEKVDGFRIYDILTASENRLAALCRNERIQDFLSSGEFDEYNIYGEMIKGRLALGKVRRKCFEGSRIFFDHLESSLPSICVDNILGYLGNEDLRMLEKMCIDIENSR